MGFTWTEIKKWATSNGCEIKKKPKENYYTWNEKAYDDLGSLVTDLYNHKTNNKFKEHQENYAKIQTRYM